jgi:regulator of protease activity HflC (stomatin/prohibitin superfamily)
MADVKKRGPMRRLRSVPTSHIVHLSDGKVVHDGAGLSFWFRPLVAAISEVPVDERDLPLMFHGRTEDFQDVVVQTTVTYRVVDPARAARRIDFSIDPDTGAWRSAPIAQLGGMLTELSQQYAISVLASLPLLRAMVEGMPAIRSAIEGGLRTDPRLDEIGLEVADVRVVAIRPEAELERALQMPVRESLQQDADKATFERRALAVERERAISENELQNQIELAKREEQLVAQRGANGRREAEETAAAAAITNDGERTRLTRMAESKAEATRVLGEAEGFAEAERLKAYRDVGEATLLGLALKDMAGQLPNIGTLVITPDMLTSALGRFVGAGVGEER